MSSHKNSGGKPGQRGRKPEPQRGQKPTPQQSTKPEPLEAHKPEPLQSQNPVQQPSLQPAPQQRATPEPLQAQKPEPLQSQKPVQQPSLKPAPQQSAKPEPLQSQKPELSQKPPVQQPSLKPVQQQDGKKQFDAALASATTLAIDFQTIATAYSDYGKKSFEQTKAFVEKLSGVRSLDKAIEIQTEFAKQAYDTFVTESQKIRELYSGLARQSFQPFEDLVAKATAAH
jgi:hypothetical protein